jgi:hypothetical protein
VPRTATAVFVLLCPFILLGCLSNSYNIHRDELVRLSALASEERWQSVRALQRIGGDDYPPSDEALLPPPVYPPGRKPVTHVVVHSHHHHAGFWFAPRSPPPARAGPPVGRSPAPGATSTGSAIDPAIKKGNGKAATAVVLAAAVVAGAAGGFVLAASEGARYDGWVAVHPDEPLHLVRADGRTDPVRLSSLSPGQAAAARSAIVYEGQEGRFSRLGRAPLDRAGFTLTTAMHLGGIPQLDRTVATGFGGYLHLGANIANAVTLGLAGTADTGLDSSSPMLVATVAPELHIYPTRYVGIYGGAGWSFRNTRADWNTRADEGYVIRGGLVGEVPVTTRLTLQARAGVTEYVFETRTPVTWEGGLGLAIY